ncbi:MAG: Hsp20/alpha crystallin family protein [Alphaproteobacteria bacterium]|nr:Hsp20/alpha crystallin family protein [Alphaproteobacteria bacterium]
MTKNLMKYSIEPRRRELSPFGSLRSDINRLFDDFFSPFNISEFPSSKAIFQPRMDIVETDKEYEVKVDLPGMKEKDVNVEIHDGLLTIEGEASEEKEDKQKNYHLCERQYSSFHRSVSISKDVDEEKAEASFKDGVLTVNLPKKEEAQKTVRKLEIKHG